MIRLAILIILLLVLPDLFIWWCYTRQQPGALRTVLLLLPTVITLLLTVAMVSKHSTAWLMQIVFILVICVAVPKLVFALVAGTGKLFALNSHNVPPLATRLGLIFAVLTAGIQIFGCSFGWKQLKTDRHRLAIPELPAAFEGYRLIQLTDLHLGTYAGDTTFISTLVDSVNRLNPDMIVFTGDLINTQSNEAIPFVRTLGRLKAKDGVYAVLGNHDYCTYHPGFTPHRQAEETRQLVKMEQLMGWRVLMNEHIAIRRGEDSLYIAGVENIGKPPFPSIGKLDVALQGIPENGTTILLSHDPWHWRHGVVNKTKIALTLSGHTHALQMQIGRFSPAAWFMPEWGGLYKEGEQQLYVSTGIGGSAPYRLGAWPKIEVFTLSRK